MVSDLAFSSKLAAAATGMFQAEIQLPMMKGVSDAGRLVPEHFVLL